MADNVVTVSGMFGRGKTYFSNSPVVIDISGLQWPDDTPFSIVRMEVVQVTHGTNNDEILTVVGDLHAETLRQSNVSFDISSALRAIWSEYDYEASGAEVPTAQSAITANSGQAVMRNGREYFLRIYTEYVDSQSGEFVTTQCSVVIDGNVYTDIPGGLCVMGGYTEWERSLITDATMRDVSSLEHTNPRNGDASTKPRTSPERVGSNSITSWVDVSSAGTKSIFYPASTGVSLPAITGESDDPGDTDSSSSDNGSNTWLGHSPLVLRDSIPYADFLFVNRRGAVETCSGQMLESMSIEVSTEQYSLNERPSFMPTRSLTAISSGGRRLWSMSSGYQTREWAEWWIMEFLMAKQRWMRYPIGDATGRFVPVIVEPAKKQTVTYDRTKQQMVHVDFTVTLALEG